MTTQSGKELDIVNYKRFLSHSKIDTFSHFKLRLVNNGNPKTQQNHKLMAQYLNDDGKWENLGLVCELSREKHGLKAGLTSSGASIKIAQSLGKKEVQLLFNQAKNLILDWRKQLEETKTPDEINQYANTTWHL